MPKAKKNKNMLVKSWIDQIDDKYLTYDGNSVYCSECNNKEITCDRKSQLTQHVSTSTHKMNVLHLESNEANNEKSSESNGEKQKSTYTNNFYVDMCKAMIAIKIPWRCLDNQTWTNFLSKYTRQQILYESTLRKNYLDVCYNLVIKNIRSDIGDNYIWIFVDETTDKLGRQVANLIVGKLCEETIKPHLLSSQVLERTNHATIARFVNSNVKILLPREFHEERVLLLVTDAAAYVLKARRDLKIFYPNIIHLTCLVHEFNRVAEEAPLRIEEYRTKLINIPLPPEPILTRWGTWIEDALFYAR